MDAKIKQQYLADSPPTVVRLEIKTHFDALKEEKLKRYAHFMSRSVCPLHRISRSKMAKGQPSQTHDPLSHGSC
jgi:dipeptidyl-peptidase-3